MSAAAYPIPSSTVSRPSAFGIFLREMRYEVLRALRTRAFSLSVIGFPVMFYCLFGLLMNRNETLGNVLVAKYLLGGYSVFGSLGAAVFGIGVGVSLDRSAGWLELKRASPMPPLAYVLAKCVMAMVFSVIITVVLGLLGISAGHVHLGVVEFARITGIAMLGAVPFSCLGLALSMLVPANAAGGVANLVYLPMSFLSGLFVPLSMLPNWLQRLAPALPSYHLAQMMYAALGASAHGTLAGHLMNLLGFTMVMLGVAWLGFRRSDLNA